MREREKQTGNRLHDKRERERKTETERDRARDTARQRQTDRQTDRVETETDIQRWNPRQEKQTDR